MPMEPMPPIPLMLPIMEEPRPPMEEPMPIMDPMAPMAELMPPMVNCASNAGACSRRVIVAMAAVVFIVSFP